MSDTVLPWVSCSWMCSVEIRSHHCPIHRDLSDRQAELAWKMATGSCLKGWS